MSPLLKRYSNGQIISLESSLASGGEGFIWNVFQEPNLVAKFYFKAENVPHTKLQIMLSNPPYDRMKASGHTSIAWPIDLLITTETNQIIGFLMEKVSNSYHVFDLYNTKERRLLCPLFNYSYLHRTARNLASAIHSIHISGYVIGDLNESNVLVSPSALITLVDTDSFQVRNPSDSSLFRCHVGKEDFTAPEIQGKDFTRVERTKEQDLFALAVLLFKLLMEGTHPFDGKYLDSGDPPNTGDRILAGHFPYSIKKQVPYSSKPHAPDFQILSPTLRQMFIKCFEDGHTEPSLRPSARVWEKALAEVETNLMACSNNSQHLYGNHYNNCPWCQRAFLLKRDPFPSIESVQKNQHLNLVKPTQANIRESYSINIEKTKPEIIKITTISSKENNKTIKEPNCFIHNGTVTKIAFLADNCRAISASKDTKIRLWDIEKAKEIKSFIGYKYYNSIAFSPNGRFILFGNVDETIRVWDIEKGVELFLLQGHRDQVLSVAFSPDSSLALSGSLDKTISVWDLKNKRLIRSFNEKVFKITNVIFSPNNHQALSASTDKIIRLWDITNGKEIQQFDGHFDTVTALAFCSNGQFFWSGSEDKTLRLWNVKTGKEIKCIKAHSRTISDIRLLSNPNLLLSASYDKTVKLWDTEKIKEVQVFNKHLDKVHTIALSPNNKFLLSGSHDKTIRLWGIEN